jgi:hypothetical protein
VTLAPAIEKPESRRAAAIAALLLPPLMLMLAVVVMVQEFPRVLFVVALLLIGLAAAWYGLLRRGTARALGFGVGLLALVAMLIVLVNNGDHLDAAIVIFAGSTLAVVAAKAAVSYHAPLPEAPAPKRAVLFYNPKSGGGKAERFKLAEEARRRGIEPIELTPRTDLEPLVRDAGA